MGKISVKDFKFQCPLLGKELKINDNQFNFGICGFLLYYGPILVILGWSIFKIIRFLIKNRKNNLFKTLRRISLKTYMYTFLMALLVVLSIVVGYILFNVSNSTIIATIIVLLYNRIKEEI